GFTEQDEGVMGEYLPTGTREMPAAVNLSISQQFQSQETVNSSSSFGPAIVSNGEMFSATPAGSKPVKTASANKPIIQPIRTIVIDAINLWAAAGRDVSLPTMVSMPIRNSPGRNEATSVQIDIQTGGHSWIVDVMPNLSNSTRKAPIPAESLKGYLIRLDQIFASMEANVSDIGVPQ